MNKRNRIRLVASFAALALSAAAILAYNQTFCRYLTAIKGEYTFAPAAKKTLTATIENEAVKLAGQGEAYVYLHVPADLQIESITVEEQTLVCTRADVTADTAVHKAHGDGQIVQLLDEQGQMVFQDGDVIKIAFPAIPEVVENSENVDETDTNAGQQSGADTKADTNMDKIHVIVVPINEKGGSAQ